MPILLLFIACVFLQPGAVAFNNPSFEDEPKASVSPIGWTSFTPGSTPDILPGAWGLQAQASDGNTCVGLVTRADGSSEDISQDLPTPLKPGVCYTFSARLAHLPYYVGYNQPVRLRVWGGPAGAKAQLLCSSPLIPHSDWRQYTFEFVPSAEVRCITLEAHFGPGVLFFYKGNILIDQCTSIKRCDRA